MSDPVKKRYAHLYANIDPDISYERFLELRKELLELLQDHEPYQKNVEYSRREFEFICFSNKVKHIQEQCAKEINQLENKVKELEQQLKK